MPSIQHIFIHIFIIKYDNILGYFHRKKHLCSFDQAGTPILKKYNNNNNKISFTHIKLNNINYHY